MHAFFQTVIDTLFPPSKKALLVSRLSSKDVHDLYQLSATHGCATLASYRDARMRALIHEAKYSNNARAIAFLGELLGAHLAETYLDHIYLIPIPLAAARMRERGYNQVLRVAEAAFAHCPHATLAPELLTKVRNTPPQTTLHRSERLSNLRGAFACAAQPTIPKDAHLILLDDITTTGSTLSEAQRALLDSGYTHITRLALAHA